MVINPFCFIDWGLMFSVKLWPNSTYALVLLIIFILVNSIKISILLQISISNIVQPPPLALFLLFIVRAFIIRV